MDDGEVGTDEKRTSVELRQDRAGKGSEREKSNGGGSWRWKKFFLLTN